MQTSEQTLKQLSEAIDAFAAAKVANNESLIRFSIGNLQQFINAHVIIPAGETGSETAEGDGTEGVQ